MHAVLSEQNLRGPYNPRNRPVQDLVTYHEIGRKELGLDSPKLLRELATAPVEPVQRNAMRVALPRGSLAPHFSNAWAPADERLLTKVCQENRRYLKKHLERFPPVYTLKQVGNEWQCDPEMSRQAGGLSYNHMVDAAREAGLREMLTQFAEEAARQCEHVIQRVSLLARL